MLTAKLLNVRNSFKKLAHFIHTNQIFLVRHTNNICKTSSTAKQFQFEFDFYYSNLVLAMQQKTLLFHD